MLSEDYFSTDQVVLGDPSDELRPFTYQGQTGALVLAGGQVSELWPDTASPSGWNYTQVSSYPAKMNSMAVGTDADGIVYTIWAATDVQGVDCTLMSFKTQDSGWVEPVRLPAMGRGATPRACYDLDQRLNFYAVASDGSFTWWTPAVSNPQFETVTTMVGAHVDDAFIVPTHRPEPDQPLQQYLAWALIGSSLHGLVDGTEVPGPSVPSVSTLLDAGNCSGQPYVTFVDTSQRMHAFFGGRPVDFQNPFTNSTPTVESSPVSNADGTTTLTFVIVADGGLYVTPATTDPSSGGLDIPPSIPLQNQVVSAATTSTGNLEGLFYVDAGLAVHYVRRDPATGAWQSFPIHQAGQTSTSVQMWRAELSIVDANGTPVPGLELTLTALGQLDVWQESGGTLLQPGGAFTATTNSHGRVTVAIPAAEMSTSGFTVAADGLSAVTVAPDGAVHSYLTGTGTLNTLSTMSGATLQAAQTNDGGTSSPVFPSSMTASTASAAASTIGQAMIAGHQAAAQQAPANGQTQSFSVAMSAGAVSYASSTSPQDLGALLRGAGAPTASFGSWWDDVKHDAESVYHGIRTGVIDVTHAAGTFLSDAEGWAMSLAIRIGDDIVDAIDLAVKDLRSAIHFVSSVFHALGADIDKALKWLRAEIAGLFTHTVTAADTLYGWLMEAQDNISPLITLVQNDVDTFFTTIKGQVNSYLTGPNSALNSIRSQTLTTLGTPPPPVGRTNEERRDEHVKTLGDPDPSSPTGANNAHGNWLLHKVESLLPSMTSPYAPQIGTDFLKMLTAFGDNAFDAVTTDALKLWHALVDSLSDPKDLKTKGVGDILDALANIVDSGLGLLELVIDDLLQLVQTALTGFEDVLQFPLDDIPIIGDLLRLAGISDSMTLGRLACLIAMFPAVLAKQVVTRDSTRELFEFPTDSAARHQASTGLSVTQATGLNYAAASLQGILTMFAVVNDLTDDGGDWTPPEPLDYFSNIIPNILLAGLLVVSWPGDGHPRFSEKPFSRPMPNASALDRLAISVYAFSLLEWALNSVEAFAALKDLGDSRDLADEILKWLNTGLGVFLVAVGCTSAIASKQDGGVIAGQYLSEITLACTFLKDEVIKKATEDTSLPAFALLDFFCGAGAAVAFAAS